MSLEARFWAKVERGEGCWEWRGFVRYGYGLIKVQAKGAA